jgi:hypothetical protein
MIDVNVTIAESFFAWMVMVMVVDEKEQGTKYLNFLFIAPCHLSFLNFSP